MDVRELTAGFRSGKFTPLEVAQATLARAEQVQERFNAFSLIDVDAALAMAEESTARWRSGAPLSGIDACFYAVRHLTGHLERIFSDDRVARKRAGGEGQGSVNTGNDGLVDVTCGLADIAAPSANVRLNTRS